jgi:hypothetical protein
LLVHSIERPPASAQADGDSHVSDVPLELVTVQHVSGDVQGCPLHMYGVVTPLLLPLPPLPLLLAVPLLPPLPPPLLLLAVPPLLPLLPLPLLLPPSGLFPVDVVLPPHAHASAIAPPAAKSKRVFVVCIFIARNLRTAPEARLSMPRPYRLVSRSSP